MTLYRWTAHLQGKGTFPLDMLRYDKCYPARETDVSVLLDEGSQYHRMVHVERLSTSAISPFHLARWQSFGWTATETDREKAMS